MSSLEWITEMKEEEKDDHQKLRIREKVIQVGQ